MATLLVHLTVYRKYYLNLRESDNLCAARLKFSIVYFCQHLLLKFLYVQVKQDALFVFYWIKMFIEKEAIPANIWDALHTQGRRIWMMSAYFFIPERKTGGGSVNRWIDGATEGGRRALSPCLLRQGKPNSLARISGKNSFLQE